MKTLYIIIAFLTSINSYGNNDSVQYENKNTNNDSDVGYVFDIEGILEKEEIPYLDSIISKFHKEFNREIIVITTKTILPYNDMLDYGAYLRRLYGEEETAQLIVIIISKELKRTAISTSKKAMINITDEFCNGVINDIMIPYFKKGFYTLGVKKSIEKTIDEWKTY